MSARALFALLCLCPPCLAAVTVPFGQATLTMDDQGRVTALEMGGTNYAAPGGAPAFEIETEQGTQPATAVTRTNQGLDVRFGERGTVQFTLAGDSGFAVLRVAAVKVTGTLRRLRLFALPVRAGGTLAGQLNGWYDDRFACAVMATDINVHATYLGAVALHSDNQLCSHRFLRVTEPVKEGRAAVRFNASSLRDDNNGWSAGRQPLPRPTDLTGLHTIRAWVHGDGSGAVLKIQLRDQDNGARDTHVVLNFTGWRQVSLGKPSYDTLHYDRVTSVDLYYNNVPSRKTVSTVIDGIEAVVGQGANERTIPLAGFEDEQSPLWTPPSSAAQLVAQSYRRHGIQPAGVGLIACPRAEFERTIERFERAAGLPCPQPDATWGKRSPRVRRPYLLALYLTENDVDEVIRFAQRGRFDTILIFQTVNTWCTTGHYTIDTKAWPRGLDSLREACDKIHRAGIHVGFHYLGAGIYPPDAYIAPKPDPRLMRDAFGELAGELDDKATFIPLAAPPKDFPAKDVDYLGSGAVVQLGDELIHYTTTSLEPPYGLKGCTRAYHGTAAAAHGKGARVAHMMRSYGYYLYDMDTSILDEIADHVTRVLNACQADMVYWDGSEQLQGDHWYYNAKLHHAFYSRLKNKDTVCQGSSMSHYSWHIHSRLASADGHGDLKGYLDERRPAFKWYRDNLIPVDIGWYSILDNSHSLDEFEYILNKAVGYDASVSIGISPDMLRRHAFLGVLADRVAAYERARSAGPAPLKTQAVLQEPGRREYRLVGEGAGAHLQRVLYEPRHDVVDTATTADWSVEIKEPGSQLAFEVTALDRWARPGPSYRSPQSVLLEDFRSLRPYQGDDGKLDEMVIGTGKAGMTHEGVTQRLELLDGAPGGGRYALYSATSTLAKDGGWSAMARKLDPPLDLSKHQGIGFWLRGDGKGGQFKLQPRDEVGAADWYLTNDFVGWRYIQLPRATAAIWRTLDWSRISRLIFYYNGLPATSTVACGIAGIRSLPALDTAELRHPSLTVDDTKLSWPVTCQGTAWLFAWPGEPTRLATPGRHQTLPPLVLPPLAPGRHRLHFGAEGEAQPAVGVRVLVLPPERLPVRE